MLLFFSILLGCLVNGNGQSNIYIDHYTKDYGLNYRWVYDITQDDYGFLWLATHTGLRRYDGEDFVTYQNSVDDTNSISNNTIHRVTTDDNGNIWAYSIDKVFNRLDLKSGDVNRISTFIKNDSIKKNITPNLRHFGTLSNGDFIVLLHENDKSSLWKYIHDKNAFEHLIDITTQEAQISYFTERSDGKLWLWTMGNGYYLVDLSSKRIEHFLVESIGSKTALYETLPIDKSNYFWYPSSKYTAPNEHNGLKRFKVPKEVDVAKIERIRLDNLGNIWFYHGDRDLFHFDTKTEILEKFVNPMFRKSRGVQLMYHFFEDKDGAFWNGHFFGAVRFTRNLSLFNKYLNKSAIEIGLDINQFSGREILELTPTTLLVKENEHDLFILDLATQKAQKIKRQTMTLSGEMISKPFYSMVYSHDGYLWTNQFNKLIKTNIETGTVESFNIQKPKMAKDAMEDPSKKYWPKIFEDASNNLWWCDPDGINIFDRFNNKMIPVNVKHNPSSVNADFKFASYDVTENVIYGTYDRGLYIIDCKNKSSSLIEIFSEHESYDVLVTSILKWKSEFWLSTNKGLIRYNPKTKERISYTRKEGLPSNIVYSTVGSKNHLWLATNKGLCQFDPDNMQIATYYKAQGLPHNEFNIWSYLKTSDGHVYFGGINGIVGFNPDDFKISNEKTGHLNLVEVSKFNQKEDTYETIKNLPYATTDKIVVGSGERSISFKYKLTKYDAVGNHQYAHFMEGLDNDWINDGHQNEVRYVEIPPGKYTFRVKATGFDNIAALNEIEIPIEVKQYWYFRWWAIAVYMMIIMSAFWMLYRYQLHRKLNKEEAIRIKELDNVKTKMYTNITHEFRTPLTVMLGMNDAVKDYINEGEIDKIYHANEMIDRNGKNLLNLVNQMLELSKLESGKLQVDKQQGNIVNYLKYRLESFQSYAEEKGIQIHFRYHKDEIMMDYDVDKVSYIVGNLVSNAIKFTPKGGSIYVDVNGILNDNNEPYLQLKVKDAGIGIAEDKIERIFDRFYQVDDTNIRKGEGTGIGLALVKELVKLLNGIIHVKSEVAEGTEFTVLLPITKNEALAESTYYKISDEWSERLYNLVKNDEAYLNENQNTPLVLVVEDNADVSHYIGVSIKDNYRTVSANDGIEGIEKAIELIPDVIISDIMMPGKDGFELCATIKKDERTSHIPVILLTGKADVDSKIEGLQHGADAYIEKPFNRKELLIRLKNLMTLRAEIQKRYSEIDFNQPISELPNIENTFLSKIRTIILEHIEEEDFGIVQLCKEIHVSRAQLHRKLIALTGESTSKLVRKIRLEEAKELLSLGELNVSEVAYMVGFKTQAHFSRVFSETFGISPSKYRSN